VLVRDLVVVKIESLTRGVTIREVIRLTNTTQDQEVAHHLRVVEVGLQARGTEVVAVVRMSVTV
jgi:predicted Zn-ribbon and HTH transcriptional regulator